MAKNYTCPLKPAVSIVKVVEPAQGNLFRVEEFYSLALAFECHLSH